MHTLWYAIKRPNLGIVGIEEGELYVKRRENIFTAIIPPNSPNLGKEKHIQIQATYRQDNIEHIEHQIDRTRKSKSPNYNVVKMISIQNK